MQRPLLVDGEIEALRNFIDPRSLGARALKRTGDGAVVTGDGRRIADPGFVNAIEKIVQSWR